MGDMTNSLTFLLPQNYNFPVPLNSFQKAAKKRLPEEERRSGPAFAKPLGDNGPRFELVISGYITRHINEAEEKAPCRA